METIETPADDNAALIQLAVDQLKLTRRQIAGTLELLDEGNTVPFITRYRKEATGGLDEEQIRAVQKCIESLRELATERKKILKTLTELGKLTPALQAAIEATDSLKRLEELYAPYRSKRKTRADEAREMGLEPLAKMIWAGRCGDRDLERVAASCVGKHPDLTSAEIVLRGARDLLAERIAEDVEVRDLVRKSAWKTGQIVSKLNPKSKEAATFQDYSQFEQSLQKLPSHRVLALDRGESRGALKVKVNWDQELSQMRVAGLLSVVRHPAKEFMNGSITEALKRLINPAIEREIRKELTVRAQRHAADIFSRNLRQLLLQPPLLGRTVLAIDPGFRSGCKVAVLNASGELLEHSVVQIIPPQKLPEAEDQLAELVQKHHVNVISIGNGTASREAQELVSKIIDERKLETSYIVVNEAGASIYSASEVGRQEFPDLDATVRGTISIGRRLQDPLSELVKIEPQHIGVGMYQHDLAEKTLESSLSEVVESCVNHVGVELNHASVELLKYVSGLNRTTARAIADHRREQGPYRNRRELLNVAGVGEKTFEQAAGFLRIREGDEPLDATWIHPESYELARELIEHFKISPDELRSGKVAAVEDVSAEVVFRDAKIADGRTDRYTANQVLSDLLRPGRDPREDCSAPLLRTGVTSLNELKAGTELAGVVTNVVDFGAFVDVGLKSDGLVHISRMADQFVASPLDHVAVGQTVQVWVESVDEQRQRVSLSMIKPA